MSRMPRYVLKAGEVVAENGEIRGTPFGTTQHVAEFDMSLFSDLQAGGTASAACHLNASRSATKYLCQAEAKAIGAVSRWRRAIVPSGRPHGQSGSLSASIRA